MTDTQEKIIELLKIDILKHDGLGQEDYEYKEFKIVDGDTKLVFLLTEVGHIGDEGTMASIFCRTRRHIAIGPKGKIQLLNGADQRTYLTKKTTRKRPPRGYWNVIHSLVAY